MKKTKGILLYEKYRFTDVNMIIILSNHIAILYALKISSVAPIVFKKACMAEDSKRIV